MKDKTKGKDKAPTRNVMTGDQPKPEFIATQVSDTFEIEAGETFDYVAGTNGKPSTALVESLSEPAEST